MSVRMMSLVWDAFEGNATELVLALALADIAGDAGDRIYPSVGHLAEKSRQSERNVQYLLAKFRSSGFLEPIGDERGGRSKTRHYRITATWIEAAQQMQISKKKGRKRCTVVSKLSRTVEQISETVQMDASKGANDRNKGCNSFAPDPSRSIQIRECAPTRAIPTGSRGAPEKTKEELRSDCIRLAGEGFTAAGIVDMLRQYGLTLDEVETWIAGAPQQP